ncbi:hypothetical protein [Chromohalobacter israelensis]|uniref:Transmembrane protein n=1 Tax=Chromohalobacter israelensis (strain ATCC BAA-138 / DSM 3043 / CIP 106854 / NCIMB 13768 / 1H11) TaxID=290398 RepID=Q1R0T2_CHRI1|nr:hypothetical protein [Chromohalobacter salexigens]ABE57676.1 hypothetical protein Csal_0313 [Chromohalobacter salexigens DSM 3043]
MSSYSWETIFALGFALFGGLTFLLGLACIILAPLLINKADDHFSCFTQQDEILFKSYPVSFARMGRYGLMLMSRAFPHASARNFDDRPDRRRAIEQSPRWLRMVLMWIYGGFGVVAIFAVLFGCAMSFTGR